jgi:hypothetical protein
VANLSSVLISFLISACVLGWTRRKAISQTTLWPSSPQAHASLVLMGSTATNAIRMCRMPFPRNQVIPTSSRKPQSPIVTLS